MKAKADPNIPCTFTIYNNHTALHFASQEGHTEIVTLLLEAKANPNTQNDDGGTPILLAAHKGNNSVVKILDAYGADVTIMNKHGITPLFLSIAHRSSSELINILAANNPNVCLNSKKSYRGCFTHMRAYIANML